MTGPIAFFVVPADRDRMTGAAALSSGPGL
jgi:hypothetical protein